MYIQQHTLQKSEIMNSLYLGNMAESEGLDMGKKEIKQEVYDTVQFI